MKLLPTILLSMMAVTAEARTLTLGIDLSGSNPVFKEEFARVAGTYAGSRVAALSLGDVVSVRSFGARDLSNLRSSNVSITRKNRPDQVARQVAQFIAGIPSAGVTPQPSTNLVAFLEFGDFDCARGGEILLITDGLESSSYADADALMKGKAKLPEPQPDFLKGCTVTFYGLGVRQPAQAVKIVREAWRDWFEKAGATFTAVIP